MHYNLHLDILDVAPGRRDYWTALASRSSGAGATMVQQHDITVT
jgi:hypothetical protein